jgi:uncharacterized protein
MNKNVSLDSVEAMLARSGRSHTVLLTSFRRNGQGMGAPVGMMAADGKLFFMTPASTWKVRRMAHTPHVTLALCTFGGKAVSPAADGVARRLAGPEARRARKLICVGMFGWSVNCFFALRYPGDKTAVYEVSLVPDTPAGSDIGAHRRAAAGSGAGMWRANGLRTPTTHPDTV